MLERASGIVPSKRVEAIVGEPNLDRYSRQIRFPGVGEAGQRKLLSARVAVCGCGALGTASANALARAGVGFLRIIDRDFIERNNLQRQLLFDEADIAAGLPKAEAAARKLRAINSEIVIEAAVSDLDQTNIEQLCGDVDLLMDGTDNFETRYLINDFAVKTGIPWIYGGCIGSEGRRLTILPGKPPCLRCLIEAPPLPGASPTCETAGILNSASAIVAGFQVAEALKVLVGAWDRIDPDLLVIDLWENSVRRIDLRLLREQGGCRACREKRFDWLEGTFSGHASSLCGRNAVQVVPPNRANPDWDVLHDRIAAIGPVTRNEFLLRFTIDGYEFAVFRDGRAIIKGTDDVAIARSLYARYLGS